jgi:hypothetical protein
METDKLAVSDNNQVHGTMPLELAKRIEFEFEKTNDYKPIERKRGFYPIATGSIYDIPFNNNYD